MKPSVKVAKNSLWLIVQPLLLNLLSLFAIPYIARVLGQADYGRFILGFSLVAMVMPLSNLGLRAVMVRQVAEDPASSRQFARKMLGSRCLLALAAVVVLAVLANVMGYDTSTKLVVYVASLTVLSDAVAGTLHDVLQAFEHMKYVAYSRFIGGLVLTVLSVAVLFVEFGLMGITLSYVIGAVLTMAMAWYYAQRFIGPPSAAVDWRFLRSSLASAAPFFYPTLVGIVCSKVGVSLLPLFGGVAAVGTYGAASSLIERLGVIPDGICTAIYPTMAILYLKSPNEAARLFRKYYEYLCLLGLPVAVGGTIIAGPIVALLFGRQYLDAVPVFKVLCWWMFLLFLQLIQSWTLGAIHRERETSWVSFITGPLGVVAALALIPHYHALGIAWANVGTSLVSLALLSHFIRRSLCREIMSWDRLWRLVGANVLMGLSVYSVRNLNVAVPLTVGLVSYPLICLAIRVVTISELKQLVALTLRRATPPAVE